MASLKKESKITEALKGARSLNDVLSAVDLIGNALKNLDKISKKVLSSLSNRSITIKLDSSSPNSVSASREIEVSELKRKQKTGNSKPLKTFLDDKKVKTPKEADLVKSSTLVQDINDAISELQTALRVLRSKDFAKFDDNNGAVAQIKAQIKQAERLRDDQLKAMSRISKQFTPKEHLKVVDAAVRFIESELKSEGYTRIQKRTFVLSASKDIIHFQTFIVLRDLVTKEGYAYDQYSYVLTGVLSTMTGEFDHYLTTLKDPRMPGKFPIGKEVETVAELGNMVKTYNQLDSLIVRNNKIKLTKGGSAVKTEQISKQIKTVSPYIRGMRIKDKEIYIRLDESVSGARKKKILADLIVIIKSVFLPPRSRNTAVSWREDRGKRTGNTFLIFSLSRTENLTSKEFVNRVGKLVEELKLNPRITREIVQDIVNRNEP